MHNGKLLIDARECATLIGCSVRKFHQLRGHAGFPAPVSLGQRSVRWRAADIVAFVDALPIKVDRVEPRQLAASRIFRSGKPQGETVAA